MANIFNSLALLFAAYNLLNECNFTNVQRGVCVYWVVLQSSLDNPHVGCLAERTHRTQEQLTLPGRACSREGVQRANNSQGCTSHSLERPRSSSQIWWHSDLLMSIVCNRLSFWRPFKYVIPSYYVDFISFLFIHMNSSLRNIIYLNKCSKTNLFFQNKSYVFILLFLNYYIYICEFCLSAFFTPRSRMARIVSFFPIWKYKCWRLWPFRWIKLCSFIHLFIQIPLWSVFPAPSFSFSWNHGQVYLI